MILQVHSKDEFINSFLSPLSRINNTCVLDVTDKGIHTLLAAADNTVILYGQYKKSLEVDEPLTLNLPDLGRLIKILQCIDEPSFSLHVESNHIRYKSDEMRFKYHLLDSGIISSPPINIQKIKGLKYDTTLTIPYTSIINLIKSANFTIDIHKVYIQTKDGNVYAELNDMQSHNVDSICLKLGDSFKGTPIDDPLPISFETIRVLAGIKCDTINIFINTKLNVMTFEINTNVAKMTYIVSGLAK